MLYLDFKLKTYPKKKTNTKLSKTIKNKYGNTHLISLHPRKQFKII